VVRLGSNEPIPLDVRFIATNKAELADEVAAGRFRADLFYRLNVVTLRIPPLAERREDVALLFLQLVREAAGRYRRDFIEPPPHVVAGYAQHDWPGNVRELRNAADRYVLGLESGDGDAGGGDATGLADRVAGFERAVIAAALRRHGGSLKPVYEELGISRKTLYEKMQRYRLDKNDPQKATASEE
jgi:two-component system C4-dicarboxylate transport response regulator DctD